MTRQKHSTGSAAMMRRQNEAAEAARKAAAPTVIDLTEGVQTTHIYLRAWDRMMGSHAGWSNDQQRRAQASDAPWDAIHSNADGTWARLSECPADLQARVKALV